MNLINKDRAEWNRAHMERMAQLAPPPYSGAAGDAIGAVLLLAVAVLVIVLIGAVIVSPAWVASWRDAIMLLIGAIVGVAGVGAAAAWVAVRLPGRE